MSKEITRKEAALAWAQEQKVEAKPELASELQWGLVEPVGGGDGLYNPRVFTTSNEYRFRIAPEPPAKKFRPWTPDEVPIGAIVRPQDFQWRRLITGVDADGRIELYNGYVKAGFMLDYFFYSADGGKTWLPCGVEVVP